MRRAVRLAAGAPSEGDGAPSSWCLDLRHIIDDIAGAAGTYGRASAPRVSGSIDVDRAQRVVFAFGGACETVKGLTLGV